VVASGCTHRPQPQHQVATDVRLDARRDRAGRRGAARAAIRAADSGRGRRRALMPSYHLQRSRSCWRTGCWRTSGRWS
jgi:hypothetical protein